MGAVACQNGGGGGGGNAGSTAGGGEGGGSTGSMLAKSCGAPTPILQPDGSKSGYVKCDDGSVDRVEKVTCILQNVDTCKGDEDTFDCHVAADCQAAAGGVCMHHTHPGVGGSDCGCEYQCQTDADCGSGTVCVCAGVSGRLEERVNPFCSTGGNCMLPSDCPSGECSVGEWEENCYVNTRMYCRTPDDTCRTNKDCGDYPHQCEKKTDATGTWSCNDPTCTI